MNKGRCIYCFQLGHFLACCPIVNMKTLIDSGADAKLLVSSLAAEFALESKPWDTQLTATAPDGRLLCTVVHWSSLVIMNFSDGYQEEINFYLYNAPQQPIVLGCPWLIQHNPHKDWFGKILSWSKAREKTCFREVNTEANFSAVHQHKRLSLRRITTSQTCQQSLHVIWTWRNSSVQQGHLLTSAPHCENDLLSNFAPPKAHLYSLTTPGHQAMEEYFNPTIFVAS